MAQLDLFGAPAPAKPSKPAKPRRAARRKGPLVVATWNVNGIRKRHAEVAAWIEREAPDVVCLQEIKAGAEQVPAELTGAVGGYHAHWHGHKGYSGVALLLGRPRFGDDAAFTHPPFDLEQRIVAATHDDLVFASVYVPNGGKDYPAKRRFLEELCAWAEALRAGGKRLVLCGDLNVAHTDQDVHPGDRHGGIGQRPDERALIDRLLAAGLVDLLRRCAPSDDHLYTWWAPWRNLRARNLGWRIDYVCAAAALVDAHVECRAFREVGTSDHGPVVARLRDPFA